VAAYSNVVRIGYARVSGRSQDHQMQLDALAAASCREVIVETASTRGERPKLRATLDVLKPGDTLVIYKPDRVARSIKELLVLLEDELHARGINLHILTGICAGLHKPNAASMAEKMLFLVAAMAAEMERELIQERTRDGLARRGGPRPQRRTASGPRPRYPRRGHRPAQTRRVGYLNRQTPQDRPINPLPRTRTPPSRSAYAVATAAVS
jgi:DNA invertase Pin-like site-specific DNA recombinase